MISLELTKLKVHLEGGDWLMTNRCYRLLPVYRHHIAYLNYYMQSWFWVISGCVYFSRPLVHLIRPHFLCLLKTWTCKE